MINDLFKHATVSVRDFDLKKGSFLYRQEEEPVEIFKIQEGLVGLYFLDDSGKECLLRTFGSGEILGHRSFLAEEKYHASAVALQDLKIQSISTEDFTTFIKANEDFNQLLLKSLSRDLGLAERRFAAMSSSSARHRISESLVFLKIRHPNKTWTRKEIADFSGSTLESVTRWMSELDKNGLIEKQGRDFFIKNPQQLLEFSKA